MPERCRSRKRQTLLLTLEGQSDVWLRLTRGMLGNREVLWETV
jgi:hypothetical protein